MVYIKSSSACEYFDYDNDKEKGSEKLDYIYANGKIWSEVVTSESTKNTYYHHTDSYKNVLSLRTKDLKLTKKQRDMINEGDRLLHSDEKYNSLTKTTKPYSRNKEPYGAGCIISHTQSTHDKMIKEIMDGVPNPESVDLKIYSLKII